MTADTVLLTVLELAVPMWIERHTRTDPGNAAEVGSTLADIIASQGDVFQGGKGKKGETAKVFNAVASGLGLLARQPGGVTFAGRHWCTDHAACTAATDAAGEGIDLTEAAK